MSRFTTSLTALILAFAPTACSGSGAGSAAAPNTQPDKDGDGASDAKDLCDGTSSGVTVGADGCGAAEDGDHDGVPTANDLCPGTPAGVAVDAFGCSADQRKDGAGSAIFAGSPASASAPSSDGRTPSNGAASNGAATGVAKTGSGNAPAASSLSNAVTSSGGTLAWAASELANPPETGSVNKGFMAIVVDPKSDHPFVFHTFSTNVTESADGYQVAGSLFLTTPLGMIPIANASVTFAYGADRTLGLETVRGDASVPFPGLGFLSGVQVDDLVSASVGLDVGANLKSLGAPLNDDRSYLFFRYHQGFSASVGPVSFAAPGGEDGTLVVDPSDPFVFMTGNLFGMDAIGPIQNAGIGLSLQGLIPFSPTTTWGLADGIGDFAGNVYVSGSIPLKELPMTITGEMVSDLNPNGSGVLDLSAPGREVGFNGSLDLTASFLKYFSFSANLANASVGLKITQADQRAYLSGVVAPDRSFLPAALPLHVTDQLDVAGLISKNIDESYLVAQGHFALDGGELGRLTGLSLGDLVVEDGRLSIDKNGFHLVGALDAGVALTKDISLGANAQVDAEFADSPTDFHVDISGDLAVAGVHLVQAHAHVGSDGLTIAGTLENGVTQVAMTGTITGSGVELHGQAGVSIDVSAGKSVVEKVTDGTLCGYDTVRDGALCGYAVITSGAVCGYDEITDGAVCGYQSVTDGALCGYATVTSIAICGGDLAANAAVCGTESVCSAVLGLFGASSVCKDVAKTCNVPQTCTDFSEPLSCTNFNLPKTCDDLSHPKSCQDPAQPKSCQDLTKPRTCNHTNVIPDYDFGTVKGSIAITLGTSGLSGQVSGQYCPTTGSCATVAGGRLEIGDPMEACIDVPGGLGEFCAAF